MDNHIQCQKAYASFFAVHVLFGGEFHFEANFLSVCVLFGDGASACVVTDRGKGYAIEKVTLGADGEQADTQIVGLAQRQHRGHLTFKECLR